MSSFVPSLGEGVDELWHYSSITGYGNGIRENLPYTQEEFLTLVEKYKFLLFHFDVSPNAYNNNAYQTQQGYLLIVTSTLRHEYETAVANNDACEPNYRNSMITISNGGDYPRVQFNMYPPNIKNYSADKKIYVQATMSSNYNNGIGTLYLYGIK